MTTNIIAASNLSGGVVSDKVYSRNDVDNFSSYAKELVNMTPQIQGGLASRDGTQYVGEVKDSASSTRLIEFVFSQDDAYILEVGDQYIRFFRDKSQILLTDLTITAATKANPCQLTIAAHGLSTGDQIYVSEVVGMTELNGRRFDVTNTGVNTITLGIDSTNYTTYVSGGVANEVYEIASPYTAAQIWDIDYTQSGNTLLLVHPSHAPRQLVRTTDTNWALNTFAFSYNSYMDENTSATTITPSGTSGSVTLTASTSIFATTDVGRYVRWYDGAAYHELLITAYTSGTAVTATFLTTAAGTTATTRWALGSFSATTGYPETVGFYQQRLHFGATESEQDTVWVSALGDIDNFSTGVADDDGFKITLNSTRYNRIRFLEAIESGILIGTLGDTFVLTSADPSSGYTPSTASARVMSSDGASNVKPIKSGRALMFSSRTTRKIIEVNYAQDSGYSVSNVASLAEHLSNKGIVEMAYQEEPNSIIWMAASDGSLISLTHDRTQKVSAWSSHQLGRNDTAVFVNSIRSIPSSIENEIWMIVERDVDGTTRQFVEVIRPHFFANYSNRIQDAKFLDCSIDFTGTTPAATLTPAATTGDNITFTAGSSVFTANDAGKYIRTTYSNADGSFTYSKALIVTYNSGTSVSADIITDFENTSAITSGNWTLSSDTFEGAWHLEGETVSVFADGCTHPDVEVVDGSFTLQGQYTTVTIGYDYEQKFTTLDLNTQVPQGTGIASKNSITDVWLKYARSLGGTIGREGIGFENIVETPVFGDATPLVTGKRLIKIEHGFQDEAQFTIKQTKPLPMNITGYVVTCEVHGG